MAQAEELGALASGAGLEPAVPLSSWHPHA